MNEDQYIPSRFRSRNVDRFRQVLIEVAAGTPEVRFSNTAMGLSPTTAIARVSDALIAVMRGLVFYEDIDADKIRENRPLYRIYHDQNSSEVIVTQRRHPSITGSSPTVKQLSMDIVDIELRVEETTFIEDVTHFAALFGHYRLRGKATILGMLPPELEQQIRNIPNVILTQISPNEYILS